MAEFCLDCWNKLNDSHLSKKDVNISKTLDLCEGCTSLKPVVVGYKRRYYLKRFLITILFGGGYWRP